jgi:hypothetical protein
MNWWRAYHGISTDPKYQVVMRHIASHGVTSRHGEIRLSDVVAIWVWLIDFSSQNTPRGSIEGIQIDHIAVATGLPDDAVDSILQAFTERGMINGNLLTAFDKRQPSSTIRMRNSRANNEPIEPIEPPRHTASQSVTPRHTASHPSRARFRSRTTKKEDRGSSNNYRYCGGCRIPPWAHLRRTGKRLGKT